MASILYLHGFLSSPSSLKANQTRAYLLQHFPETVFICPELSNSPGELEGQLKTLLSDNPDLLNEGLKVIGSSMGGYLATWLTEQYGGKAVLINPAVAPFELLKAYLGEHVNPYTNTRFVLAEDDIEHVRRFYQPQLSHPEHYKVLLQTGDETLDYREAVTRYAGADIYVEEGGDHSFVNYEAHLEGIMAFLNSDE